MIETRKTKITVRAVSLLAAVVALFAFLPALPVSAVNGIEDNGSSVTKDGKQVYLYPGGMPFGVRFFTDGVLVVGFADEPTGRDKNPAAKAGIRIGDVITAIDGTPIESADHLTRLVEASGGKQISLSCTRDGNPITVKLTPTCTGNDGKYRTGVWVRDSGAGIGTVTFLSRNGTSFSGLGHGICDSDTGKLVPLRRGTVTNVTVSQIVRGQPGTPGEIKGYFSAEKTGALLENTDCGVWGTFTEKPTSIPEDALPVASRQQIHDGDAYIWCTLDSNKVEKYAVSLSAIDCGASGNKCFTVTVTDKALLERSGGIVQGMSGSPIIQDGRLVGAVTHVLINDPTTGYGIFAVNMLQSMPEVLPDAA